MYGTGECPICGGKLSYMHSHRCPPSTIRSIDAANRRAENDEDSPEGKEPFYRTEGRRIAEGFEMMGGDNE